MIATKGKEPTAEELAIWQRGARTVRLASKETGLSRHELFFYMADGTLRYVVKDKKGTRLIAYGDLVRLVNSLNAAEKHTAKSKKPLAKEKKLKRKVVIKSIKLVLHGDGTVIVKGTDNARLVAWCDRHGKQITIDIRNLDTDDESTVATAEPPGHGGTNAQETSA